jgi:hypothetical protein
MTNNQVRHDKLFLVISLVPLVGFILLNISFASSPIVAFSKWLKVFEFVLFGFYIIKTRPSFSRALWCLSVAILYSSIIAIAQFFLQHSVGGLLWFLGERTFDITTPGIARAQFFPFIISNSREILRAYATFPHPNVLGGFLAIGLPLVSTLLIKHQRITNLYEFTNAFRILKKLRGSENQRIRKSDISDYSDASDIPHFRKSEYSEFSEQFVGLIRNSMIIYLWLVMLAGIPALFFTFSRSAWIAFIILFLILKFKDWELFRNWKLEIRNLLPLVGFMALLGFFLLPYFKTMTLDSESVFVRNELNSAAISMIFPSFNELSTINYEHIFVGVGLGNFLVELPKYYPHRDIFFLQPIHNIFLLVLSETGVIGFILFCWLISSIYLNKELKIKNYGITQKFPLSIIHYSLFIILLLGLVDHYPLTLQQGQLLFTFLVAFAAISM